VEFAILLPFIMFVFLVGGDWCRVFYAAHTVQDCARSGALGASGMAYQEHNLTVAERVSRGKTEALKDAANLNPPLQASDIAITTTDAEVAVTVTYSFQTVTNWPGVAGPTVIQRTVSMPLLPSS
jgi:Flp pilus assembly protein TadG